VTLLRHRLRRRAVILETHKPAIVAAVALANKTARIVWAVLPRRPTTKRKALGTTTLRRSQIDFSQERTCASREERASVMRVSGNSR
jgi:hypothetical protein